VPVQGHDRVFGARQPVTVQFEVLEPHKITPVGPDVKIRNTGPPGTDGDGDSRAQSRRPAGAWPTLVAPWRGTSTLWK
jgi:hypothetical protein